MELIARGAEAKLYKVKENVLRKIREPKKYRIEIIDNQLRNRRNKREFKVITKLYDNNINVPKPIDINEKEIYFDIEYISGENLKSTLNKKKLILAFNEITKIHNLDIIHGDLTTLNMIDSKDKIYIIDLGLSEFTTKIEDKAVDLNLFFICIKNEHPELFIHKEELEKIYMKQVIRGDNIIQRVHQIEKRGRNKDN